jgi:hypothetical protein
MTKLTIMQHSSHHPSWISIVRDAVEAWRKQNGWSRETAAQMIVEAHERNGLHQVSGIVFDPHTRDAYARMKVNADRIFRWLDEVTKDRNLLPANFILSILTALPADLRMHTINKMLWPVELGCRQIGAVCSSRPLALLQAMLAEAADAESAVAALVDGIDPGELETAHQKLTEAITAFTRARDTVESLINGEQHV